jgi:hypothetical protein
MRNEDSNQDFTGNLGDEGQRMASVALTTESHAFASALPLDYVIDEAEKDGASSLLNRKRLLNTIFLHRS